MNPAARLRNAKVQRADPDPLTLAEAEKALECMKINLQWQNYFEFAFFTGMRTSELLALQWGDIDFGRQTAKVHRARVRKQKTATILNSRALSALGRQKQWTFMKGEQVFLHPATGGVINDDKLPRLFWTDALKACGMRHRDAYQTRHTFATLNLMVGANPMRVARQIGHATMQMTLTRYSKSIDRADAGTEKSKLEARFG